MFSINLKLLQKSFGISYGVRKKMYVPVSDPPNPKDYENLLNFLTKYKKTAVLTGAGISTESGIPDYRSKDVGLYARTNHKPIQYNEFLKSSYARQRYWARNFVGWSRFSQFQPNMNHYSLNSLEMAGKIPIIITQNVDSLHTKAGSNNVIELHGTAYHVLCLNCKKYISRHDFQDVLLKLNPNMEATTLMIRPDGDVEISDEQIEKFTVPSCVECGGILKPDVVFFGDNVPKQRVEYTNAKITESDSLLVLGTSLSTFSAYRIILQAKEENKEIFLINIGPTRADKDVDNKISTKCGNILPEVVKEITCHDSIRV